MTIRPGEQWGSSVARPEHLRIASGDRQLTEMLTDGTGAPTAVSSGDLARTLGNPRVEQADRLRRAPIDLVEVVVDDADPICAVAHVVARSPWWRGSWWHGPVVAVMNAEFMGEWDVAPRGHPNDGRIEVFEGLPGFGVRQRLECRRRLPAATHVPHPGIRTRSVRSASWTFDRATDVLVDGRFVGRGRSLAVAVRPDAATLHT